MSKTTTTTTSVLLLSPLLISLCVLGSQATCADFVEVRKKTGIHFWHVSGSLEKDWITEVNGSGVALFDYDGDMDLDIYFVCGSTYHASVPRPRNALYRNDGDWKFSDVTQMAGVGDTGWGSGASVADIDNDGLLDLYVTNQGPNVLYRNRGDGTFERLKDSGLEDPAWSTSASFADFDGDGNVDVYVANYLKIERRAEKRRGSDSCTYRGLPIFCGPGGMTPAADRLYLGSGDGKFRDVTASWNVANSPASFGLGTLVVDVDRDDRPDLVVANDTQRNFCWLNQGSSFTEAGVFLGLAYNDYGVEQAGMGLASADLRGTGRDDIFVTNFEDDSNTLYLADGERNFVEGTYPAGLGGASYPWLGWGCFFFDADGDADLDLYVANGHVAPQADAIKASRGYRQRNQLFLLNDKGKFSEPASFRQASELRKASSRGAACGDLDGDGDPDIVVSNMDARPSILENRSPPHGTRWLSVHLEGSPSNRAAIGARVRLIEPGQPIRERCIQSGMSFASQCELVARFALPAGRKPRELRVDWPSGRRETFDLDSSSKLTLREGNGHEVRPPRR